MALVVKDRVRETSTTTGTGTLTLAGAVTGFQTFSSAIGNTNTTYYTITNGAEWETGIGTVAAGTLGLWMDDTGSPVVLVSIMSLMATTFPPKVSVIVPGNAVTVGAAELTIFNKIDTLPV